MDKKMSLILQITRNCNQNCIFCSNPPKNLIVDYDKFLDIIESMKTKINEVTFSGGEPTLHHKLTDMISHCKSEDLKTRIITNGKMLSDIEYAKKLADAGLDKATLSFHSHLRNVYDELVASKGSYECIIKAAKNLSALKIELSINATITALNYKYLKDYLFFIEKNLPDVKKVFFSFVDPIGTALINQNVVPRLVQVEQYLYNLISNSTKFKVKFEFEAVPLCYLDDKESFSSESQMIRNNSGYYVYDLEKERVYGGSIKNKIKDLYHYSEVCDCCVKKTICSGILKNYFNLFGDKELYPLF